MTARLHRHGTANAILIVSMLVLSALFQSELGGPGSLYNSAVIVVAVVFLCRNPNLDSRLILAFGIPVVILVASVFLNADTLHAGGYRSAIATAIGYTLLMVKPVPVNHRLLRRLAILFLLVGGLLSVGVLIRRGINLDISGYQNFNVNSNSAALFFVQSVLLSLVLVRGALGWVLAIPFLVLVVTTGSRAGAVCSAIILVGFALFGQQEGQLRRASTLFRRLRSNWRVWAVGPIVVFLAVWLRPDATESLALRLEYNESRRDTWSSGVAGIDTVGAFLIGYGPATLTLRTGAAPHNSYIEAVASSGIFFVVTTLLALWWWLHRMMRAGSWDMIWIVPPVLIWGAVETILFNGIETLWMYTMLFGIVIQSRDSGLDVSRRVATRATVRRHATIVSPRFAPVSPVRPKA